MLVKCLTTHYAATCDKLGNENLILRNVASFRGPRHLQNHPSMSPLPLNCHVKIAKAATPTILHPKTRGDLPHLEDGAI